MKMQTFTQGTLRKETQMLACSRCGFTQKFENQLLPVCPACQHTQWTDAVNKT
jgi:rubrerythrin